MSETSKTSETSETSMTSEFESLTTKGYCVLPVLTSAEVSSARARLVVELRRDPYYKDATLAWNQGMVMGGFGGLATPHSYHNPVIRELRLRVHGVGVQLCPPGMVIEQCPDRTMSRAVQQCPGSESWHRDESPSAGPGSTIFGGWINLNDHDEFFACCPGSQRGSQRTGTSGSSGSQRGSDKNFQTIPKEERPKWKAAEVKVVVPPGHMVVFYENIVHRVYAGKKRREYRLFVGWRIGTPGNPGNPPIDPTLRDRMVHHQVPKIKGGMQPPVYARQHMASWIERVAAWSVNVKDEHCYDHLVRSGKNKDKTFRIAKRFPMNPGMSYPAYTKLELFVLHPHTPEEYATALKAPAQVQPEQPVQVQHKRSAPEAPEAPEPVPKKARLLDVRDVRDLFRTSKKERTRRLGGFDIEGILSEIPSRAMEDMSDRTLRRFSRALRDAVWDKQAFCVAHECTREEALAKGALGGFNHGENGAGHFYFEPKSGEFTAEQIQLIDDHTACCYNTGQPCAQQLDDEWDGDPCECAMGSANGSYCYEVGLGPDTFEEECDCFAIKPICSRTETGRTEFIHTVEQFKDSVGNFALLDADSLVKVGAFLKSSMQGELRYASGYASGSGSGSASVVYKPYPKPEPEPEEPEPQPKPKPEPAPAPDARPREDYENLFRLDEARQTQLLGCTVERLLKLVPSRILKRMSGNTLEEVSYQLRHAIWDKKAFCTYSECTREEAVAKGELGGYTAGELGTHYFFFEPKSGGEFSEFTDDQRQLISDHTACCFLNGQPCACDEDDDDYEPCECQLGNDLGSYWFQMNLGPNTFDSECGVDLIEPMFVRTFKSGDFTAVDNIYSMEELKGCFDLNTMDVDKLIKVAAFLQNPGHLVGHPVELSVKETIAEMDGVATYKCK